MTILLVLMTMPSASFDKVDVREIGLRSFIKSQIVGTLGKGGTSASFHTRGTLHSRKEVFKISVIGGARISAYSFRTQLGRLSGSPAREVLTAFSFLATVASVTDKGSSSAEVTRTFSDRGDYPCITLTKASFIFSLKTLSSQTKLRWRMVLRSHPVNCLSSTTKLFYFSPPISRLGVMQAFNFILIVNLAATFLFAIDLIS